LSDKFRYKKSQTPKINERLATKVEKSVSKNYAALTILPDLIQRVQTFCRELPPLGC
jgi:hypothetical protein